MWEEGWLAAGGRPVALDGWSPVKVYLGGGTIRCAPRRPRLRRRGAIASSAVNRRTIQADKEPFPTSGVAVIGPVRVGPPETNYRSDPPMEYVLETNKALGDNVKR